MSDETLAVVGGGVIGLAVARRAAQAGLSVRVHRTAGGQERSDPGRVAGGQERSDPGRVAGGQERSDPGRVAGGQERSDPGRVGNLGASWVAGGMLTPHSEGLPGEERLLAIGLESLRLWHSTDPGGFLDGLPPEVVTARESLVVAVDRADVAELRTVAQWLGAQGQPVTLTDTARDVEPLLAQGIRHGFRVAEELAVDNRLLVAALAEQCERLGVRWAPPVKSLGEARRGAGTVLIANGIDAPALWPGLPVRPVKGEVLRLRWRRGCLPAPKRVVRARVHGRPVYLVPRADGVVVGATQYEHGRDTAPSVSGVRDLLEDACAVMPALGEYELAECGAGLRPMTPDNMPIVGRLDERTLVATGHGRSGFLLAPWTAERVAAELAGEPVAGART